VLTLFGKYVGTLKNEGFYFVNPFCTSVNPAAKTKLNQSGDVQQGKKQGTAQGVNIEVADKKISLKIMTLKMLRVLSKTVVLPQRNILRIHWTSWKNSVKV
jgi:regulator of protease activity HflC (stomatin/prohibitin superfamily)